MTIPAGMAPFLAAAVDPAEALGVPGAPRSSGALTGLQITDLLVVISSLLGILTILIVWAVFIRKPKNEQTRTRIYKSHHSDTEEREDGTIRKRKKHKRPRRAHRQRNPTLSEAGGLPPLRSDQTPPPV